MKKLFLASVVACAFTLGAANVYELFDRMPINGKMLSGAALVKNIGQDDIGCMKITGNGASAQYAYQYDVVVEPGKSYGISFAAKSSSNKLYTLAVFDFKDKQGKSVGTTKNFRILSRQERWRHNQFTVTAPANAATLKFRIRLCNVAAKDYLLVDNLRSARSDTNGNFFHARELETIFDNWTFLGQKHFENYSLGSGAKIVTEWKHAKAGESFLDIRGDNSKMQYPLIIENITIKPEHNYRFRCWINTNKYFKSGVKLLIFDCYDASGKRIKQQPRCSFKFTDGKWEELVFDFKSPAKAVKLTIMVNIRSYPKDAVLRIDQLDFREGTPGPEFRQHFDPDKQIMTLACPFVGDQNLNKISKVVYTIKDKAGKVIKTLSNDGSLMTVSLADIPDGEYTIYPVITNKDNTTVKMNSRNFGVYKKPYWRNDYGVIKNSDPAPTPWCDLKRSGSKVVNWNGSFEFNDTLAVTQFTDKQGNKLFKSPLAITVNNAPVKAAGKITWEKGLARISASLPVAGNNWQGKLYMTIDYTGFVRYKVEVTSAAAGKVTSADVKYAVNSVEFVHRADASWTDVGAVDLKKHKTWSTKHRFHEMMLGDIDRGIIWYAPKLYPEGNDYKNTVSSAGLNGNFMVNMVNAPMPVKAGKPFAFEFAIMPYPCRPVADNWRKLRFRTGGKRKTFEVVSGMKPMKYAGLPASRNDAATDKAMKAFPPACVTTLYQIPLYITDTMPEFRYFETKWIGYPARHYNLGANFGKGTKMRKCDPRQILWQELYCYMAHNYLKRFKWKGFYYDCYGSDLISQGGETLHPTFEVRNFHERIFKTCRDVIPDFFTITHAGAQQGCSSIAFSDVILMGEQYRAQCMQYRYMTEFLSLDEFRYENAVTIGADRMFLPQYRQLEKHTARDVATHIIGLCFLHNNMLYPNFVNKEVTKAVNTRLHGFCLEDADFFAYWKPNPDKISSTNKDVVISYWKKPDGKILAFVFNSKLTDQSFALNMPGKELTIYDPLTDKTFTAAPGKKLTVKAAMALMVWANSK